MNNSEKISFSTPENGGSSLKRISVPYFWRGGTIGGERKWHEPLNWYNRSVPGWFDIVVIRQESTMSNFYPYVEEFANDVSQVIIGPGGQLSIGPTGKISIDGLSKKGLGIINEGEIFIEGELTVHRTLFANVRNKGAIYNTGSFAIDQSENSGIINSANSKFENYGEFLFL